MSTAVLLVSFSGIARAQRERARWVRAGREEEAEASD
jgi:hypothetical protein